MTNKKHVTKIIKSILLFAFNFLLITCNSTEPVVENLEPGRRDYEWKADTLYSPNNTLQSIWGSAPDDVWVVGPGGITIYDECWHFDGGTWNPYEKYIAVSSNTVFGLSQSDVWMGGDDGKIFHFDGKDWTLNYTYKNSNWSFVQISDIRGKTNKDVYAVGLVVLNATNTQRSFLLHFNGNNWQEYYFTDSDVQFIKVLVDDNGDVYIFGLKMGAINESSVSVFYVYGGGMLKEIYKKTDESIRWINMEEIGEKTYFIIGSDICRYINGSFLKTTTFNEFNFGYAVFGRHEKDMFVNMTNGLAHFNGQSLEYLYNFSNDWTRILKSPIIFEKEVFFAVHDYKNDYNIILHGTLKN